MTNPILYRKRIIPDECILLKDDVILSCDEERIVTTYTKTSISCTTPCFLAKDVLADMLVFSLVVLFWGAKIPFFSFQNPRCYLSCFLLRFSCEFLDFLVNEPMVFIYIPADCIQHEFFIHFF